MHDRRSSLGCKTLHQGQGVAERSGRRLHAALHSSMKLAVARISGLTAPGQQLPMCPVHGRLSPVAHRRQHTLPAVAGEFRVRKLLILHRFDRPLINR
jgi:hypothetical protein